jgi:hypothetical protein
MCTAENNQIKGGHACRRRHIARSQQADTVIDFMNDYRAHTARRAEPAQHVLVFLPGWIARAV